MTKIAINKFKMIVFFSFVIFALIPEIVRANPIFFTDLYYPFSSNTVNSNTMLWLFILVAGIIIELFIILLFVKKHIEKEQKRKVIFKIFIPITILNIFTMIVTQVLALYFAFFAELFPIIVESIIIYVLFKNAVKKSLLNVSISIKNIIVIIFFANILSFLFGLLVNFVFLDCERYERIEQNIDVPTVNFGSPLQIKNVENIPGRCTFFFYFAEQIEKTKDLPKYLLGKRIAECDKLSDYQPDDKRYSPQFNCYLNYAKKKNNIKLCYASQYGKEHHEYVDSKWGLLIKKEACNMEFALENENYEMCDDVPFYDHCPSVIMVAECYYEIATSKKDYNGCDRIKIQEGRCEHNHEEIKKIRDKCYEKNSRN